jgi:hypothetical protein
MAPKRAKRLKPGPPARYGYRPTLTIRLQEPLYEVIKAAAFEHGKSLSEEIEDRLGLIDDLETAKRQLESMREASDKMHRIAASVLHDATVARTAARIQALRDAGFRILREVEDGKATQVIISLEVLEAEAKLLLDDAAKKEGKSEDDAR